MIIRNVPYMNLRNFIKTVPLVLQVYFHIISHNKENICNGIQMNGHECNGIDFYMRCKMECSIQQSKAKFKRTFHLSLNENICTVTHHTNEKHSLFVLYNIKNIFLLFTTLKPLNTGKCKSVLIALCQAKGHPGVLLNTALYHCIVLLHADITFSMVYLFDMI